MLAAASTAYAALLVFAQGRPSLDTDAGVVLSVAARLLQGDHLYRDVWDNKDPLFFYVDAAALWVAGWRGPFLLDIVWVATAAAAVWLLLGVLDTPPLARVAGFLAYPLLLTGEWYHAGYSMLAALALAPLAAWLSARGSPTTAGVVVGLGVLFKVNLALVLVAAPVTLFLLGVPVRRNVRHVLGFLAGLAGTLALAAGLLAARGELVPDLHVLRDNVSYANDVLVGTGRIGGIHGHVRAFETLTRHARPVIAMFFLAGALAVGILVRGRGRQRTTPLGRVSALLLGVGLATAVTLALTTAWDHHVQMLAYPGALLVVFIVAALNEGVRLHPLRWTAQAAAVAGALLLLGVYHAPNAGWSLSRWTDPAHSRTAAAPKASALRSYQRRPTSRTHTSARTTRRGTRCSSAAAGRSPAPVSTSTPLLLLRPSGGSSGVSRPPPEASLGHVLAVRPHRRPSRLASLCRRRPRAPPARLHARLLPTSPWGHRRRLGTALAAVVTDHRLAKRLWSDSDPVSRGRCASSDTVAYFFVAVYLTVSTSAFAEPHTERVRDCKPEAEFPAAPGLPLSTPVRLNLRPTGSLPEAFPGERTNPPGRSESDTVELPDLRQRQARRSDRDPGLHDDAQVGRRGPAVDVFCRHLKREGAGRRWRAADRAAGGIDSEPRGRTHE